MVASSADEAVSNANAYTTCQVGQCLKYVRTWLEVPSSAPDAITAWHNAERTHTDRNPPAGAPAFYAGGQHGHIVLSVGGGRVRSPDRTSSGRVTTVPLTDPEQAWGYPYLGWSEDLNGYAIGYLGEDGDDVATIDGISQNAANVIAKAVHDYYKPSGVNTAQHVANIDAALARLSDALAAFADALGATLAVITEPAGQDGDADVE